MTRVAINGFGRIGRSVFRLLCKRSDIEVAVINDIAAAATLSYLFEYDTVMGRFEGEVRLAQDRLHAGTQRPLMCSESEFSQLPWRREGIDFVIEATGRFRSRAQLAGHLEAGAGRVILTVPPKDALDALIVLGVNDELLRAEHRLVSNASCTTNCLAPLAKVLHENFGFVRGVMNTVHAYTNDQRLADVPHKDLRRSRAAAENIIPTTTGAARAVGQVLPELAGRLDGLAMRVPVPDGSIVDLVARMASRVRTEEVCAAVRSAAQGRLHGILEYSEAPLVSSDVIGNPHSCIFDATSTQTQGDTLRVLAWYDNEWGYSNRVVDLMDRWRSLL
jgi:glyceraldehyde 3-phosphate dehydrogenase